jgi:hypothetical protein
VDDRLHSEWLSPAYQREPRSAGTVSSLSNAPHREGEGWCGFLALHLFPDSGLVETCELAGSEAVKYLPEIDIEILLKRLSRIPDSPGEIF